MDQIQVQEIFDKLKEQIGELTYQVIYRDIVIEKLQEQILELQKQQVEIVEPEAE